MMLEFFVSWIDFDGLCGNRSFAGILEMETFILETGEKWKSHSRWFYPKGILAVYELSPFSLTEWKPEIIE